MVHVWRGVLREFADRLGVTDASTIVSLGEGGTPLIAAPALSRRSGADVYIKFEGMNPTGSFKDRGMTVALSRAVEHGAKAVICASTGNTSASAAAYAAHAGITAAVLVPEGKIAMGKLSQAVIHGGELIQIRGNFDDCLEIARDPADLVAELIGKTHQYPDGAVLYLGTMFAPTEDRGAKGQGFTHKVGDRVTIHAPELGALVNRMRYAQDAAPWTFGAAALMRNLAKRGLL